MTTLPELRGILQDLPVKPTWSVTLLLPLISFTAASSLALSRFAPFSRLVPNLASSRKASNMCSTDTNSSLQSALMSWALVTRASRFRPSTCAPQCAVSVHAAGHSTGLWHSLLTDLYALLGHQNWGENLTNMMFAKPRNRHASKHARCCQTLTNVTDNMFIVHL